MDITGSYTFDAPPSRVWALLMDPSAIASCIPGCESLEPEGPDQYHARLTVALAAITGTYDGTAVNISLIGLSAAEPIGKTTNPPPSTGREFAVFVVVNPRTAAPAAPATERTTAVSRRPGTNL